MRIIPIVFVLLALFSSFASAAGVFTISNVEVTGNGQSAVEAKNNAIASGEAKAFQLLLERITPSFTNHLWPELEANELSDLIQGFEVRKEKLTSRHYKANLDITFNQLFVEKLLQESGISYVSQRSDKIALLPLLKDFDEPALWEDNKWKNAWQDARKIGGFFNFIIPKGDRANKSYIDVKRINSGNYPLEEQYKKGISLLMKRYNISEVLLAKASYDVADSNIALEVELVYLNEDYPERISRKFYGESEGDTLKSVMERAIYDIIKRMDIRWKKKLESSQLAEASVNVNIPLRGLEHWDSLRKALNSFDFIKEIETKYITVKYASIDMHFQDGYESLIEKLAQNGIYIEKTPNGMFLSQHTTPPEWYRPEPEIEKNEVNYEFQR